jgi:hypothetical protein
MRKFLVTALFGLILCGFLAPQAVYAQNTTQSDVIVQTIPGPTVAEKASERVRTSWAWYLTRGSGLVAAIALIILMLSGIGQITGFTFKFLEPLTAWASHRALGIAFGVAVIIHVFSLLFDHFIKFNILQLLIPWLSDYKLSLYLVLLVIITSLLMVDNKPYIWKLIHLLSYIVIFFVFIHALYLGTDLMHGILRWIWILSGVALLVATIHRLWRSYTV